MAKRVEMRARDRAERRMKDTELIRLGHARERAATPSEKKHVLQAEAGMVLSMLYVQASPLHL